MSGCRCVITPSWLSETLRSFFVYFFCVFLPLLLNIFCFFYIHTVSVIYCAQVYFSLVISNFLEEISSLSYSILFLYFFALVTEEGLLISPCYSLELCIQMILSFLFSFDFSFSSFLSYFVSLIQTTILLFAFLFLGDCLIIVSCTIFMNHCS